MYMFKLGKQQRQCLYEKRAPYNIKLQLIYKKNTLQALNSNGMIEFVLNIKYTMHQGS